MRALFLARILTAVLGLGVVMAASRPPATVDNKVSLELLPNPLVLKFLGRSQIEFVADLFWVRMANMAGRAATPAECGALLPIANLIADLAPRFKYPYFVGGVLAPVRKGRTGEYENAAGALALMTRGVAAVPEYLRLHLQKSYTEMEILHDPAAAGRTLRDAAAAIPDAPPYISKLATRLLAQAGEFDEAREFSRVMAGSEDPQIRADFELRLKQIDLEQVLVKVDDAAQKFAEREGRPPTSLDELLAMGFLSHRPVDPLGGTIELTEAGARSTVDASRLRAHVSPE